MVIDSSPVGPCWEVYMILETPFKKSQSVFLTPLFLNLPRYICGFIMRHCPVRFSASLPCGISVVDTTVAHRHRDLRSRFKTTRFFRGWIAECYRKQIIIKCSVFCPDHVTWETSGTRCWCRKLADLIFSVLICVAEELSAFAIVSCNYMRFLFKVAFAPQKHRDHAIRYNCLTGFSNIFETAYVEHLGFNTSLFFPTSPCDPSQIIWRGLDITIQENSINKKRISSSG